MPLHITCHHPVLSPKLLSVAVHFQELVTFDQISSVLSGDRMAERARLGAESPARRPQCCPARLVTGQDRWKVWQEQTPETASKLGQ